MVYYLYIDSTPSKQSNFGPYLFWISIVIELLSLVGQFGLGYYILLTPNAAFLIKYFKTYSKEIIASLLYCVMLFISNDGAGLIMIVYLNRTNIITTPNFIRKAIEYQPDAPNSPKNNENLI